MQRYAPSYVLTLRFFCSAARKGLQLQGAWCQLKTAQITACKHSLEQSSSLKRSKNKNCSASFHRHGRSTATNANPAGEILNVHLDLARARGEGIRVELPGPRLALGGRGRQGSRRRSGASLPGRGVGGRRHARSRLDVVLEHVARDLVGDLGQHFLC